jgi:hypothetical protein
MIGGLHVALRVEIDNRNPHGATEGYGLSSKLATAPSPTRAADTVGL